MDEHNLTHLAAADGVVGPAHGWQARCACGWNSHAWASSDAAAHEHGAHRQAATALPRTA